MHTSRNKAFRTGTLLIVGGAALLIGETSSAYALIDLNPQGASVSVEAGASSSLDVRGILNGDARATTSTEEEGSTTETGATAQAAIDLSADLLRDEQEITVIRGGTQEASEGAAAMQPQAVLTNGDLQAYARTALESDESLEGMSFANDRVEVMYEQEGRFLALVPISFVVTAWADAGGEAHVEFPWYSFLTVDNEEEIETEMNVAIDNALRARMVGSVQAAGESENPRFTAAQSAEVAAQIHSVLKANLEAVSKAQPQ